MPEKVTAGGERVAAGGPPDGRELSLRLTVIRPPAGVWFCVQSGKAGRVAPTVSTGADIAFDFTVRVKSAEPGDPVRLLGPVAQGPPDGRFVYVRSGTSAGRTDSRWTRRAKVPLSGITRPMVDQVMGGRAARLEARYEGTAKDGGPSCATVALLDGGWRTA